MSVFVIAEAGVNHNGSVARALEMVEVAAAAGADAVKFQTFRADALATASAGKAAYQQRTTGDGSQLAMLKRLELDEAAHRAIAERCAEHEIEFMSAPFDHESLDLLVRMRVRRLKLGSGELTNRPLLEAAARAGLPLILSTGMATLEEVREALQVVRSAGSQHVTVLHCTTEYPAPPNEVNLRAMATMRDVLGVPVGYSDHTVGMTVALAAVAMGASVLEKHFTTDRGLAGPDHLASLEPRELAELVTTVRTVEAALGDGIKRPTPAEIPNLGVARKSIVAATVIGEGESFTENNLAVKRPGTGISPMHIPEILTRRASRAYETDELLDVAELAAEGRR